MEQSLEIQALRLLLGFVMGAALGLGYDCLRPLRRRSARMGAAALDVAFSFFAGLLAFLFAMGAGSGRMGLWELASAFLGFTGYMYALSDAVFAALDGAYTAAARMTARVKNFIKKIAQTAKFLFPKARK